MHNYQRSRWPLLALAALLGLSLTAIGCGDDSSPNDSGPDVGTDGAVDMTADMTIPDGTPDTSLDAGGGTVLGAVLSGSQEVPAVSTAGSGSGTVTINAAEDEIVVDLTFSGLTDITAAHIHLAGTGENGPVILPLASAAFTSPFSVTLTATDLTPAGSVTNFADAVAALKAGETYINIHTSGTPSGELRGQIGGVSLNAALGGIQEVPHVTTAASGDATVSFNGMQDTIDVTVNVSGLADITAAHIHVGGVGMNGGVIFPLASASFTSPLQVQLTASDFSAVAGSAATFEDAVNAILSGNAYVNVHTTTNPGGELRGQIGAARVAAALGGGQEVPPVASAETGSGRIVLNGAQDTINVTLNESGLSDITAAHIHAAGPGTNGGVIFPLASAAFTSPLEVALQSADLNAGGNVNSFADAINAILAGQTYFNVHTTTNPGGELRGQIGTVYLTATLEGSQEVPPVTTAASGSATARINGAHTAIATVLTFSNLTDPTAAHIHVGDSGVNGGVIFPLATAAFTSPHEVTVTDADFSASGAATSFERAIDLLIGGGTYFNLHTTGNPGGELRGQIAP